MGDFNRCIDFILAEEGGYVNHPDDPGKETNFGISSRAYPGLNIRALTLSDAVNIYRRDYWTPVQGDQFPDPLALVLLDTAVNMGPTAAILMLQRAVKVTEDGILGAVTRSAAMDALPSLLSDYLAERALRYAKNPNVPVFGRGWYRRLLRVHKTAWLWTRP